MNNTVIDVSNYENPDTDNLANKRTVDISVSQFDIDSSLSVGDIDPAGVRLDYTGQSIVLYNDGQLETDGDLYYTPLYGEKLSYDEWKRRVNKDFVELENT